MTTIIPCSVSNIGDGHCDEINNKEQCDWDGGDCCAYTCDQNCKKRKEAGNECLYNCGSNGYNCLSPESKCFKCVHGTCNNMKECLINKQNVLINVKDILIL